VTVALRNLVIVHLTSSTSGIEFNAGDTLHVADCEVSGMVTGLSAGAANATVTVKDSTFRGTATGLYLFQTVSTLDRVRVVGNSTGIFATEGASVKVSDSLFAGNNIALDVGSAVQPTRAAIERSILTGGSYGLYAKTHFASGSVEVSISDSNLTNYSAAIRADHYASSTLNVSTDTNWLAHNGIGFSFASGTPTIYTRGNNTLMFNGTDVSGGSLTPFSTQ